MQHMPLCITLGRPSMDDGHDCYTWHPHLGKHSKERELAMDHMASGPQLIGRRAVTSIGGGERRRGGMFEEGSRWPRLRR